MHQTKGAARSDMSARLTALVSMSDRPILLFDGVCNLCDRSVQFVLDHDTEGVIRFASLQSEVGTAMVRRCEFKAEAIDSVVLVEDGQCHIRSEAAWRIARLRYLT